MAKAKLTFKGRHGYVRDIGWRLDPDGKRRQPRFLLGHDEPKAQLAALRLEQLWDIVVQDAENRNAATSIDVPKPEPAWTEETLAIAEAIRKGLPSVKVPYRSPDDAPTGDGGPVGESAYASYLHYFQQHYPMIAFLPSDPAALAAGQERHRDVSVDRARQARTAAAIANAPMPATGGPTLHAALDAYVANVTKTMTIGGELTPWGANLTRSIESLKRHATDTPLSMFGYAEVAAVRDKLAARPNGMKTKKPLAVDSVRGLLKAFRMAIKWISRHDFNWRMPDDVESAWRYVVPMAERVRMARPVSTFTVEELTVLWRYATDHEKALLVLALNCGFAQAELGGLRLDEVALDAAPATISRIRGKSAVAGSWALWPESVKALTWIASRRPKGIGSPLAILTERGTAFDHGAIANIWNRLIERVQVDVPTFRFLSFKYLRKTAAQMVRNVADGETAAVFLAHGAPVTDKLLGVYSNPDYTKVAAATAKVHDLLAPMFATVPDAFTGPRKRGGANISRASIDRIKRLHAEGISAANIAKILGLSRPTVYRWAPKPAPAVVNPSATA